MIVLIVVLAVAGVLGALLLGSPGSAAPADPALPARPSPSSPELIERDRAGFGGPAGGSLAGDAGGLARIRARVAQLSTRDEHEQTPAARVVVLWAGDLDAGRYAVTVYRGDEGWSTAVLAGPAGVPAARLTVADWDDYDPDAGSAPTDPSAVFVNRPGRLGAGVVLVIAPRARGVEIAHARRFPAGGGVTTVWRPVTGQRSVGRRSGAVWTAPIDANELYLGAFRTTDPDDDGLPAVVGGPDGHTAAQAVATGPAVGTDTGRGAMDCAADEVKGVGASLAERAVFATASRFGRSTTIGAVVLRSPDGGWIWGLCDREEDHIDGGFNRADYPGSGVAAQRWTGPDQAMAATAARLSRPDEVDSDGPPRFVVLAPRGADHVRINGHTAVVRGRLAEITLPADDPTANGEGEVTVEALRGGRVIGRVPAATDL